MLPEVSNKAPSSFLFRDLPMEMQCYTLGFLRFRDLVNFSECCKETFSLTDRFIKRYRFDHGELVNSIKSKYGEIIDPKNQQHSLKHRICAVILERGIFHNCSQENLPHLIKHILCVVNHITPDKTSILVDISMVVSTLLNTLGPKEITNNEILEYKISLIKSAAKISIPLAKDIYIESNLSGEGDYLARFEIERAMQPNVSLFQLLNSLKFSTVPDEIYVQIIQFSSSMEEKIRTALLLPENSLMRASCFLKIAIQLFKSKSEKPFFKNNEIFPNVDARNDLLIYQSNEEIGLSCLQQAFSASTYSNDIRDFCKNELVPGISEIICLNISCTERVLDMAYDYLGELHLYQSSFHSPYYQRLAQLSLAVQGFNLRIALEIALKIKVNYWGCLERLTRLIAIAEEYLKLNKIEDRWNREIQFHFGCYDVNHSVEIYVYLLLKEALSNCYNDLGDECECSPNLKINFLCRIASNFLRIGEKRFDILQNAIKEIDNISDESNQGLEYAHIAGVMKKISDVKAKHLMKTARSKVIGAVCCLIPLASELQFEYADEAANIMEVICTRIKMGYYNPLDLLNDSFDIYNINKKKGIYLIKLYLKKEWTTSQSQRLINVADKIASFYPFIALAMYQEAFEISKEPKVLLKMSHLFPEKAVELLEHASKIITLSGNDIDIDSFPNQLSALKTCVDTLKKYE